MSKKKITIELTPREAAFITLCRKLGEGYIEGVGVNDGQPTVLKTVVQRIDLKKPEELANVLSAGSDFLIDMSENPTK